MERADAARRRQLHRRQRQKQQPPLPADRTRCGLKLLTPVSGSRQLRVVVFVGPGDGSRTATNVVVVAGVSDGIGVAVLAVIIFSNP